MKIQSTAVRESVPRLQPSAATLWAMVIVLALLAPPLVMTWGTAHANGASTIIMDQVQGPYRVVVGIIPARPVIPQTHLAIQVFDASDQTLLRDTDVELRVTAAGPAGTAGFGPQLVRNEQTLRYFEVDVPFEAIGPWVVSLAVASRLGEEEFQLDLQVGEPPARIQWIWIAAVLIAILAVGAWTWLTLRRRNQP